MRKLNAILADIRKLLEELEHVVGSGDHSTKRDTKTSSSGSMPKGALGAITMLIEEGFLDTPKEIAVIMDRLKEIGHYHKRPAVSMNLLNLTKRRRLNRFKNKESKNWEYVIRK